MEETEIMSYERAALRHINRAQSGLSRSGIILDELNDTEWETAKANIEALQFDSDATKQLAHAKFHIEMALEVLEGEPNEILGEFPEELKTETKL